VRQKKMSSIWVAFVANSQIFRCAAEQSTVNYHHYIVAVTTCHHLSPLAVTTRHCHHCLSPPSVTTTTVFHHCLPPLSVCYRLHCPYDISEESSSTSQFEYWSNVEPKFDNKFSTGKIEWVLVPNLSTGVHFSSNPVLKFEY
jgi:hypothetical protein